MENLIINGSCNATGQNVNLTLPHQKWFRNLGKDGAPVNPSVDPHKPEPRLYPELLIAKCVLRKKYETSHVSPVILLDEKSQHIPQTLLNILLSNPFPRSQGPLRMPLNFENATREYKAQTLFSHSDIQECAKWVPISKDTTTWDGNFGQVTYQVDDIDLKIQGTVTTMEKRLLYTCRKFGCAIECPCNVCQDTKNIDCKRHHTTMQLCSKCNPQCAAHEIKVSYMFNPTTDLFTIVTEDMYKYRYGFGYAGIPRSCSDCMQDVLHHQIFHLVYHGLCRFCRFEFRPLELLLRRNQGVLEYKNAVNRIDRQDLSTCSTCLKKYKDKNAREKHEATKHNQQSQNFECNHCPKSYNNTNALAYHNNRTHEASVQEYSCEICGRKSASKASLKRHKNNFHEKKNSNACELCSQTFSLLSSLKRHIREQHFDIKFNYDFLETFDQANILKCEKCNHTFMRDADLKRHIESAHGEKSFQCKQCDKTFAWKSALSVHFKSKHEGKGFDCSECDNSFQRSGDLIRHVNNMHGGGKDYICDFCDKMYSRKDNLVRHVKLKHQ